MEPVDDRLCAVPGRYQQYREQSAGVIQLFIGLGTCTGTLLENGMASGVPGHYILTAGHCVPGTVDNSAFGVQWRAVNLSLRWHYLLDTSGGPSSYRENCMDAPAPRVQSLQGAIQGARLVAWDERFDYALLILAEDPVATARPQPWNSALLSPQDELFAIHHAAGNVQQLVVGEIISFRVHGGVRIDDGRTRISACPGTDFCNLYQFQNSFGSTGGGASGASYFYRGPEPEAVPRVVGVHSGGLASGGSQKDIGILHHVFQLDERFRLALERGQAYFTECGPNAVGLTDVQVAACGRLPRSQLCSALDMNVEDCLQISAVAQSPSMGLWSPSTSTALIGGSSMGSDPLSALRAACLEITVELQQAALIQFHWRVSSEDRLDGLSFYIGTERHERISGEQDWQRFAVLVTAGQQPLRWCYEKDVDTNHGADRAWFDSLSFQPLVLLNSSMSLSLSEGDAAEELQLILPREHVGSDVEIVFTLAGTAVFGEDYTLAAGEDQTTRLRAGPPGRLRLSLAPVTAEPLILRLLPRPDDRLSQGERTLIIDFASYTSSLAGAGPVVLPTSLQLTISDDEPPVAEQLSVGERQVCVILRGGDTRCWYSSNVSPLSGLQYPSIRGALRLATGSDHLCWLTADGRVRCVGRGRQPFTGGRERSSGSLLVPADLFATVELIAGGYHNCALSAAGRVRCWGSSSDEASAIVGQSSPPDDLPPVEQISAGAYHSCALLRDARVRCWGDNRFGQSEVPEALAAGEIPLLRLESGGLHNCALSLGGDIHCWGDSFYDQIAVPADLGKAVHIAAGAEHSCATQRDGVVRCWGRNHLEQLQAPPLLTSAVRALDAGGNSSCALLVDGSLRCWGGDAASVSTETRFDNAVPDSLLAGDITMVLTPQRLMPGERAAIRFAAPTLAAIAFSVKFDVFGEGVAAGVHYRVVDSAGEPLSAEADGSYLAGNPVPQAFVEALDGGGDSGVEPVCCAVGIPAGDGVAEYGSDPVAAAGRTADRAVACPGDRYGDGRSDAAADRGGGTDRPVRRAVGGEAPGNAVRRRAAAAAAQAFGAGALVSTATLEFVATAAMPTAIAATKLPLMGIRVTTVRFSVAEFQAPEDLTVEIFLRYWSWTIRLPLRRRTSPATATSMCAMRC